MNERELKEEIEKTYELRNITYQRLRVQNFWTRILEIYYSVFTALLSVCSIMKNGEFISQHSVCFTVAVAKFWFALQMHKTFQEEHTILKPIWRIC